MSEEKLQDDYKNPVSAVDMVELAKQQYEQKKVSDYKFPTEIVELPSKGLIYPKDNALASGKVEMKYKNAIMIAARILGYGKDYEVEIDDPSTPGLKQKDVIDLTQFESHEYDGSNQTELHQNEFKFELPQAKRTVTFQALTESKERKIKHQLEAQKKQARRMKDSTDRQLTTRLKSTITSIDGDTSEESINHFVDNELFAADSRALRAQINSVVPDIDLTYEFISEETGERSEMLLPMDLGFFWPKS